MANAATETDQGLLAAWQQGDVAAFERLYARHSPALLAYAIGMLGSRDAAEEVLQQVFIGFVAVSPRLPGNTNVRAYLFAGARNRIMNLHRDRQRAEGLAAGYEALARPRTDLNPGPDPVEAEEMRAALNAALARLPADLREPVLLHTQGGLTFNEMAFALKVPRGTVVSRYQAGIERLREMLNHDHA